MNGSTELPLVSIVIPMLDERGFIEPCLESFAAQDYPADLIDVIVVDGGSTDGSRGTVDQMAETASWLRVVENPLRRASAAFNAGVQAAKGEVVCLFSAHGVADRSYIRRSVEVLRETGAAGVGGRYLHVGLDPVSNAVGLAMVSPFGMASPHRFVAHRKQVDTISHPAYDRAALLEVGPFDESLLRNSDYELNHRLCESGAALIFDPSVVSVYRPRGSLRALGRQFWWYGRWKERVARRHPGSLKPRHLVAPAAVAFLVAAPVLSSRPAGRRIVAAVGSAYVALLSAAVVAARPQDHDASVATLAACFPVMHVSWGSGFLTSVAEDLLKGER